MHSDSNHVVNYTDFPFDEIRSEDGDYFNSSQELLDLGFKNNQIWSVIFTEADHPAFYGTYTYGPSHHYINRLGFIATRETHDNNTYYIDEIPMSDFEGRAHGELPG